MADKEKPAIATSESLVDFSKLPPSALDKYIDHYGLAQRYPPYPPKSQKGSRSGSRDEDSDEDDEERSSKRIDSNQPITTSTRLRPRSPTASMAHYFPGGSAAKRNGHLEDDPEGDTEGNGKDWEIPCPSHFFDVHEADNYLATVASKHFAAQPPPKEGEIVVQFLYRCRAGDKCLKVAS